MHLLFLNWIDELANNLYSKLVQLLVWLASSYKCSRVSNIFQVAV